MMLNPTIVIPEAFQVTPEQFEQLAISNRDLMLIGLTQSLPKPS
jgi:hypothetical protein